MPLWTLAPIIIAAVILTLFIFAIICDVIAFGKRCDKNPKLKYFSAQDFNLTAREIQTGRLKGFAYSAENCERQNEIIIFLHGMGPGHIAHATEIAYFCKLGYTVLAMDSLGCNLSSGKSIKGMYEGVNSAVQTYDFAKRNYPDCKIYFVGHSWGGYSALCASALRKVEKVVAISAPVTPVKTVYGAAKKIIGKPFAAILCPFWYLINFFKFGAKGNANSVKAIAKSGAQTLLVHGDIDEVVPAFNAAYYGGNGENVSKLLVEGRAHNPYNTPAAERELARLLALLRAGKTVDDINFSAATEEDAEVMQKIAKFLLKK